jgi:preprotein translocase subunit SecG
MALIVLSIHLVVSMALIGLVLLQRSEGGALGIGGGGGALMSGRGAADALAKMTSFAGGFFLITSLSLTVISGAARDSQGRSVFDVLPSFQGSPAPAAPATEEPAAPTTPDPTQSNAPQAATTQLAAAEAPPAITLGPATAAASERARPIEPRPATVPAATTQRAATPPPATTRATPTVTAPTRTASTAATTPARTPTTAPTTAPATQRTGSQQAAVTTAPRTQPLQLPGSAEAAAALGQRTGATGPESVEDEAGVAAVRRERAGPDQ